MAHLSLKVADMRWAEFWGAHRPAVLLTIVSFVPVAATTLGARRIGLAPFWTLSAGGLVLMSVCALLIWWVPAHFLGRDGQWMLATLRSFLRKLRSPRRGDPEPEVVAETESEGRR